MRSKLGNLGRSFVIVIIVVCLGASVAQAVQYKIKSAQATTNSLNSAQEKQLSFEIWPGGRRLNNTVYLIGKEYNHLYFNLSANKGHLGKHKLTLPKILKQPVTLTIDYPQNVKYQGTAGQANKILKTTKTTVIHDGKHYNRYIITLNQAGITGLDNRLLKHNHYYQIFSYIIPPAKLNDKIYWQLKYGKQLLAEDVSGLITVGVIDPKAKLPKRFTSGSSGGANLWSFPNMNYEKLANLYHRLGITSTDVIYGVNDKKLSQQKKAFCRTFSDAGITINALRGGSFMEYHRTSPKKYGKKGLVWGAKQEASYYNQPKERAAFALIAPYVDGYTFDYEPMYGPHRIPGYDDKPTIAAFAQKYGIKGKLTKRLLKGKYHDQYYRYRQELLIEPIKALRKLVDSVKMMPIYLEQGSGVGAHLDYKLYDKYVDFHCPMFYMPSIIDYYTKVAAMAKYIAPKKLIPDTTYGYTSAGVMRQTPDAVMLDIVSTAVNGAVGHRVWPGVAYLDEGLLFGAYQGLKMVAVAEDFYFDGQESKAISVKPLTYKSKVIKIGAKTLDISSPNWGSSFRYRVHKLNNDYLITLLNFNNSQDAYVELSSRIFKDRLLINPSTGEYIEVDDSGAVMVKVKKTTPAVWLVTSMGAKLARKIKLDQAKLSLAYQRSKVDFNRNNKNVGIALGRKGNISINYNAIEVDGQELICLEVATPSQKIAFNENGGRIFSWEIDGKNIVANKKLSQDGFAMDLLWMPNSARWSGDEIQTMKLITCNNDGKVATIVYSGEFKRALPGLKIKKTFTINAKDKKIKVLVELLNTQALPVTLSYWSHNTMTAVASGICYLKAGKIICKDSGTKTTIFPNRLLPKVERKYIFARNRIVDDIDNLYAEVFADSNDILLLRLPKNFMNVYRYKKGSEWMSRPITIQPTSSVTLNFSYTVIDKNEMMKLGNKADGTVIVNNRFEPK